ncbi:hypothetical protein [Filimonas lacunae]|nr:hypothetical protein [Filimonas lacunae]
MKSGVFNFATIVPAVTLCSFLFLAACQKDYQDSPYNKLESFTIQNTAGSALSASIAGNDIIIYWPSYQAMPDSITPVITFSKNAIIKPASGVKVAFDSTTTYTVTAQDGSQFVYRLKIPEYQPIPYISSFTSITYKDMKLVRVLTNTVVINGNYFIADTSKTHAFLVMSGDGTEKPITINSIQKIGLVLEPLSRFNFATGTSFKFKVVTGNRTVVSTDALIVAPAVPAFTLPTAATSVKSGTTFTLVGTNATYINGAKIGTTASSTTLYSLEVVGTTATSVTFRVPESVPLGEYRRFTYTYTASAYNDAGTANLNINTATRSITVQAP